MRLRAEIESGESGVRLQDGAPCVAAIYPGLLLKAQLMFPQQVEVWLDVVESFNSSSSI